MSILLQNHFVLFMRHNSWRHNSQFYDLNVAAAAATHIWYYDVKSNITCVK